MKITSSKLDKKSAVLAADEDFGMIYDDEASSEDIADAIDTLSDKVDDVQDTIDEEIEEDEVDIQIENNIEDHYIAECDKCHGIFISAVIESDQAVESISGTCPICGKETDQELKWVIKAK